MIDTPSSAGFRFEFRDLVRPYLEADQRIWSKRLGDGNIGSIGSLGDQDAANPRHVVARIECVPAATEISLEPAGEIADRPRRRCADIAEVAGAVTRRNVHAAAECDGQMGIVAAYAFAFVENFPRRHGGAGVLVAESDVTMDEIANGLHPRPASG
jgi:hypothetical protein